MKIYVVAKGKKTGFFYFWNEVEPLVSGYKGNKHKSFSDIDKAIEFFESYNRELFDEFDQGRV